MKHVLGLIALAQAGTWKRSTDETPWEEASDLDCFLWNYERFAQIVHDPRIHDHEFGIEGVNVNGTDVCVISMEGEEFNLANGIACDCSDPENFDFEDNDVCNDAQNEEIAGNLDGVEYFRAMVCDEPLPGRSDEGGPSDEAMCYLFNYERFTQNGPGPDYEASEWPTLFAPNSVEIDDSCDETQCYGDFCTFTEAGEDEGMQIPCNCNKPEEFVNSKDMLNKDVCDEFKNFPADITEDMSQAGLDKFESLVCGFETNFLSFGLILLCTLFKF